MNRRKVTVINTKLGYRINEEAQLLVEEKWIIEALKSIKKQRNCLQIERLQLESMRAQLLSKCAPIPVKVKEPPNEPTEKYKQIPSDPILSVNPATSHPSTSVFKVPSSSYIPVKTVSLNLTQGGSTLTSDTRPVTIVQVCKPSTSENFDFMTHELTCNDEELDLSVTNPVLGMKSDPLSFENEEEEEDFDANELEHMVIDMNMLMTNDDSEDH